MEAALFSAVKREHHQCMIETEKLQLFVIFLKIFCYVTEIRAKE